MLFYAEIWILTYAFIKNVQSRGFHLQYMFPARHRSVMVETTHQSGTIFSCDCDGFSSLHYFKCCGERLAVFT